jgi:hypothetical protein
MRAPKHMAPRTVAAPDSLLPTWVSLESSSMPAVKNVADRHALLKRMRVTNENSPISKVPAATERQLRNCRFEAAVPDREVEFTMRSMSHELMFSRASVCRQTGSELCSCSKHIRKKIAAYSSPCIWLPETPLLCATCHACNLCNPHLTLPSRASSA